MVDGVEQLEVYFGQYLPQFLVALLTPLLIFAVVAFVDLPVALVMLVVALVTLVAPALWHRDDGPTRSRRQKSYAAFGAEFLDSVQGLATLKAFGQSEARADKLRGQGRDLFHSTMGVLGTNTLARGITDTRHRRAAPRWRWAAAPTACEAGEMALAALLVILMLGVEVFRPLRELRTLLHQGMLGISAAQGIFRILDAEPGVADAPPPRRPRAARWHPRSPSRTCASRIPAGGAPRTTASTFAVDAGERLGIVGPTGGGQVHDRAPAAALLRPRAGPRPDRRPRPAQPHRSSSSAR